LGGLNKSTHILAKNLAKILKKLEKILKKIGKNLGKNGKISKIWNLET